MNIYEIRQRGQELCQTDGSEHYHGKVEPLELIIESGYGKGFCAGNIIKYACRYAKTGKIADIAKCADYAHILAAVDELEQGDDGHSLPIGKLEQMLQKYENTGDMNDMIALVSGVRELVKEAKNEQSQKARMVWQSGATPGRL